MRCQVISNIWDGAIRVRAKAPTLILCGNIGRLGPALMPEIRGLVRDFQKVFWVPYAAETFRTDGTAIDAATVRSMINESGATCLSNDVVTHEGRTIVATSGWWPGRGGAPLMQSVHAWSDDDREFIQENCGMETILLTAGSMYCKKPSTLVGGTLIPGYENLHLDVGRQLLFTNSADASGYDANRVFELR